MKPENIRHQFIKLRAEGFSYAKISKKLNISKATCSSWEQKYQNGISALKAEQLKVLYQEYGMQKQQRIKALGTTLSKIDAAISKADFSKVDPIKLLELKLKYQEALKDEYVPDKEAPDQATPQSILDALNDLTQRSRKGEVSSKKATTELKALTASLSAYDKTVIEQKLDNIKDAIGA